MKTWKRIAAIIIALLMSILPLSVLAVEDGSEETFVTAPESAYAGDNFVVSISTDKNCTSIRILNEKGMKLGIKRVELDKGADKNVWNLTVSVGTCGVGRTFEVQSKTYGSEYISAGFFKIDIAQKEVSTGVKASVINAGFSESAALKNEKVTANVVTNRVAALVRILNENEGNMGKKLVSKTYGDIGIEWNFEMSVGTAGQRVFTFAAAREDGIYNYDDIDIANIKIGSSRTEGYRRDVECKSGELTLRGVLTMPEVYDNEKVPMVILSHGFMSSNGEMANAAARLADAGYASVRFNFGGTSPSDGEFINMTVWTEVADLNAIIDYVEGLDFVDTRNIFLSGNSFGGLVSTIVAPDRSDEINSMCLWYPAMCFSDDMRDGHVQAATFDVENIPDSLQINSRFTVGREFLETGLALYPYELVGGFEKDVLIMHGTADNLVPYRFSEQLKERYVSAELIPVEGGGHGFYGPSFNIAITYMIDFLDEHLV